MSPVTVFSVRRWIDRVRFVRLARGIQKGDPCFVAPLAPELLRALHPKKNPFFRHAEAELFLARRDGRPVGRIAAIVDRLHDETHRERCGFFGYFESENDPEVARSLLEAASSWLRGKGARILRGPVNLSTNNECGLLVEGFDTPPAVMTTHNPPYYAERLEGFGLRPAKDLLGYEVRSAGIEMERLERVAERVKERGRFAVRELSMDRFEREVATIGAIFNQAWAGNWGFVPATEEEFRFSAASLRHVVDPELVLFAEVEGKPTAFLAAIPDVNVALKRIDSRLFPFGIFQLPFLLRKVRRVRLPLFGVIPQYRQAGMEGVLLFELIRRGLAKGVTACDCSWVLEENLLMRRPIESIGGRIYKRWRIYEKPLGTSLTC